MANISDLPTEVLVHIFRFYAETESQKQLIMNVSRVCPYWGKICMNSSLWIKFDGTVRYKKMMQLCREGGLMNTKEMIISETELLESEEAQHLFCKMNHVEVINFTQVSNFEKDTLAVIAKYCPHLKKCQIGKPCSKPITYEMFVPFLALRGRGLITLNLCCCKLSNIQRIFRCIADCCENLEELHFRDLRCNPNDFFPTEYFQEHCSKLKILHLDHNIKISNNKHSMGFPNLEVFTYFDKTTIHNTNDKNFKNIVFNSPNLSFLNLANCNISSEVMCSIPASSIQYLYVANSKMINARNFSEVCERWCHSLKQIDVSYSKNSAINKAIWNLVTKPAKSQVEIINLNFTQVLASVVEKVMQSCTELEVLHLEGCRNLDRGMKRIYTGKSELNALHKKLEAFILENPSLQNPFLLE